MRPLSERDKYIQKIENIINNRQMLLRNIYNNITNSNNDNPYLNPIIKDYDNYFKKLKQHKLKQLQILKQLNTYLDSLLINNNNLNKKVLDQTIHDKKDIINKIKNIKKEILNIPNSNI